MTRLMTRGVLLAALCAAACDIPTGLPKWDTTFVVQAEGTTLSVGQLLPASVTISNNAFALSLSNANFNTTLGALCAACAAANGQNAPKPAFNGSFATSIALPTDVASAALQSGSVNLNLTNNFSFDPIAPAGAATTGTITITIKSGGATIGSTTLSGATTTFAAGTTKQLSVPLTGTITGPLDVTVTVDSPAGGNTLINTSSTLSAVATPSNVLISSATVRVQNRNVTASQTTINLKDIDSSISDHVQSGALLLAINNPFNVTGNLTISLSGGSAGTITKSLALAAGQSNVEIAFSGPELRSLLGHNVTLSITGPVTAASNITVTPTQSLSVTSKMRLVISVGSSN